MFQQWELFGLECIAAILIGLLALIWLKQADKKIRRGFEQGGDAWIVENLKLLERFNVIRSCVLAPCIEELWFRAPVIGLAFYSYKLAIPIGLVLAIWFAFRHADPFSASRLHAAAAGAYLLIAVLVSHSLTIAILVHAILNAIGQIIYRQQKKQPGAFLVYQLGPKEPIRKIYL